MFGRKAVFGAKSPSYLAQQEAMRPSPDTDGVTRVFPKELWNDRKIGGFLRSAGIGPDDPNNIARTGDYFIAKFKTAREALNLRTSEFNARMRREFGVCDARPFLIIDQSIWDGPHGAFLYGNLDLVGYEDWNVLMMAADRATAEACGLAPLPAGKVVALTAAMEDHIVRAKAKWEQAHESYGHQITGRPGIARDEFDRIEAEIVSDLLALVQNYKAKTCEIMLEQHGLHASAATTAMERADIDRAALANAATDPNRVAADAALGIMSGAVGLDMSFEVSRVFQPSLWTEPKIAALFEAAGLGPDQKWNAIPLFTSKATVRYMRGADSSDPLKLTAVETGMGLVPYDVGEINGFHHGILNFHKTELLKIAHSPASDKAKHYALMDMIDWSIRLFKGEIEMAIPGL